MRIDAISIGKNPPEEVNVLIEVAIGADGWAAELRRQAHLGRIWMPVDGN